MRTRMTREACQGGARVVDVQCADVLGIVVGTLLQLDYPGQRGVTARGRVGLNTAVLRDHLGYIIIIITR